MLLNRNDPDEQIPTAYTWCRLEGLGAKQDIIRQYQAKMKLSVKAVWLPQSKYPYGVPMVPEEMLRIIHKIVRR